LERREPTDAARGRRARTTGILDIPEGPHLDLSATGPITFATVGWPTRSPPSPPGDIC